MYFSTHNFPLSRKKNKANISYCTHRSLEILIFEKENVKCFITMPFLCQIGIYFFHPLQNKMIRSLQREVKRDTDLVNFRRDILYAGLILEWCGYLAGSSGAAGAGAGAVGGVLVSSPVSLQTLLPPEQLSHVGPAAGSALFERRRPAETSS